MKDIIEISYNIFLWTVFGIISTFSSPLILNFIDYLVN
jgi:hypothetical protein